MTRICLNSLQAAGQTFKDMGWTFLTRIIELACLTNTQATTTDDQNLLDIDQVLAGLNDSTFEI